MDQINAYNCNCSDTGYVGTHCDINAEHCPEDEAGQRCARDVNECESSPCRHGACIDELLEYHCDCSDTGYEGTHCDIDIDECASNPCNQGNCTDGVNYFTCVCFAGYDGKRCDVISDNITVSMKERQSMNATPYVVASVLLAVCLVTVVVLFILRHRHKKSSRSSQGHQRPPGYVAIPLQEGLSAEVSTHRQHLVEHVSCCGFYLAMFLPAVDVLFILCAKYSKYELIDHPSYIDLASTWHDFVLISLICTSFQSPIYGKHPAGAQVYHKVIGEVETYM